MYEVNPGLVIQLLNFFRQIGYLQMLIHLLKTQNFWCELWFWYLYLCDNKPKGLQFPPPRHLFPRFHLARHLLPRDFSSIQNASGSPAVEKKQNLKNSHVKCPNGSQWDVSLAQDAIVALENQYWCILMVTLVTVTGKRILDICPVMEHPWNQGLICLFQGCHETNLKGEAPMPHKRCPVTTLGSKPLETSWGSRHITSCPS